MPNLSEIIASAIEGASGSISRPTQIANVINAAADNGIEAALAAHGVRLSAADQELLRSLSPEELTTLRSANAKLGSLGAAKMDNNVNI